MAKNRKAPIVNLGDFKKKLEEEHSVVIDTDAGKFRYKGPALITDDEMKEVRKLEKSDDDDKDVKVARIMLDDYDGFVAAGGSLGVLGAIIEAEQERLNGGDDSGEGEASSDS